VNNVSTIKETNYMCTRCFKTLTYSKLVKIKTITMKFSKLIHEKYTHLCPICRNNEFRILSTIIKN